MEREIAVKGESDAKGIDSYAPHQPVVF